MITKIELITPKMAAQILSECNTDNRNLRPNVVAHYADQMRKGEWQLTHQGIAISVMNRLIDGQHRLSAVVESGTSVLMTVTRDCVDNTYNFLDLGLKRNTTDTVNISTNTAGMINKCIIYSKSTASNKMAVSHSELSRIYHNNKELVDKLEHIRGQKGFTASVKVGLLVYLSQTNDMETVNDFCKFVSKGISSENLSPALLYAAQRIFRNEDTFTTSIDSSIVVYKALSSKDIKFARVDEDTKKYVTSWCQNFVK